MAKECVLYDRACIGCGECDYCDLNPMKLCDNCGRCIDSGKEYEEIKIDGVMNPNSDVKLNNSYHNHIHDHDCDCGCE